MTQDELAKQLGVRQSTISGYETGVRDPERWVMESFIHLAKKHDFKMTIEDIFPPEAKPKKAAAA